MLLRTLILWSLSSSDAVQGIIKESYKQARHDDDKNQPLSVQPWGRDGYKRRFWLVEGQDDTHFRLYRENNGITAKTNTWFSVAGSIDEAKAVSDKLDEENTPHARNLRDKIRAAVPRFEAGEDVRFPYFKLYDQVLQDIQKRKRRDYRLARKAAFARPEPGYSLYEGRTRGKKLKYTYSDEEDTSDVESTRRSHRQSRIATPTEPTVTASGRQVRSKYASHYGDSIQVEQRRSSGGPTEAEQSTTNGRPQRSTRQSRSSGARGTQVQRQELEDYDSDEEMEDEPSTPESGHPWEKSDNEDFEGDDEDDDEEEDSEEGVEEEDSDVGDGSSETRSSLVVKLPYRKGGPPAGSGSGSGSQENGISISKAEGAPPPPPSDGAESHHLPIENGRSPPANNNNVTTLNGVPNGIASSQQQRQQEQATSSNMLFPLKQTATAPLENGAPPPTMPPQTTDSAMQM